MAGNRPWSDPSNPRRNPGVGDWTLGVNDPDGTPSNFLYKLERVLFGDRPQEIHSDIGYPGKSGLLVPDETANQTPTPSQGHYRVLSAGDTTFTVQAMTEVGYVTWSFDISTYTLVLTNYRVLGVMPASGRTSLTFANFDPSGPQVAQWQNQT